jgi:dienelactone hydrolase
MAASRGLIRGTRTRRLRALGCFVAVLVAMTWGSAPASATIIERDRFTRPYDVVRWDCGYAVRVVGVESHVIEIRTDKKLDGNSFVNDNYDFKEVWTAADGRYFTLAGNGLNKNVKAKSVGGSVYEFTFNSPGQSTLTDSSGTVVYRDRGNLSFSFTIDFADGTFNFLGVRVSGPHPLFSTDMCKAIAPLVGTESARYLAPRPIGSTTFPMGFYEYLPPSYSASGSKSPLLLAFNGYGENGDGTADGLQNLLNTGIPRFIDIGGWPTERPLVVLALQHVEEPPGFPFEDCNGSCNMQLQHNRNHASPAFCTTPDEVHDFITYAVAHYNVDPKRVYVTGLSCGAFGAWEYLAKYGDAQVAAAIPIAGEGRPAWATAGCGLGSVALWAFHGEFDDVVDPAGSIEPMTNLAACPGVPANRARLTVYPDLPEPHGGWDEAYSGSLGDDIYTWMLAFSKP